MPSSTPDNSGAAKYVEHPVTSGPTHGDQVEILTGLHDGDRVVTQGAAYLRQPAGAD
jgi:multidrug efflux pump subunit AcrA (membrane-fusion protein)